MLKRFLMCVKITLKDFRTLSRKSSKTTPLFNLIEGSIRIFPDYPVIREIGSGPIALLDGTGQWIKKIVLVVIFGELS